MKPVTEWTPKHYATALSSCQAARQKYLKLGREVTDGNAAHSHSKLGIFLSEVLGPNWTEWIAGDDYQREQSA